MTCLEGTKWLKEIPMDSNGLKCYKHILFKASYNTEEIAIPSDITVIAGGIFRGHDKLKRVVLPEGVKSIGDYSFGDCIYLENIVIPETV